MEGRPDEAEYVPLATLDGPDDDEPTGAASQEKTVGRPRFKPLMRWTRRCKDILDNNTGLLLISLSQGFASLMNVFVKKLNQLDPPVHPLELIWVRMVMTWIVCVVYMYMTGVPDPILGPKGIRTLLAFRGLAGFVGLFGTYYALKYLSLSDTTVLSFLTPMATAITGALLLKEVLTVKQVLASIFSFVGVVLIARPEFLFGRDTPDVSAGGEGSVRVVTAAQRLGAVGVALLGVVGLTSAYTTIRAIGKRAHPMHNLGAFSLFCILTGPIAMVIARTPVVIPDNLPCLLMILAVSACGFAAQMTMTTGLQRETAGRGTMAIYVQVVFALVFERIFFHTTPPPLSILGTVIILSSAIYVALSKQAAIGPSSKVADDATLEEGLLAAAGIEENTNGLEMDKVPVATVSRALETREKSAIGSQKSFDHGPEPGSSKSGSIAESVQR